MIAYIKEEFKRAFLSKMMGVAVILSIGSTIVGMFEYLLWLPYGDISVLYIFLSGYNMGTLNILAFLFPIVASLPFAGSYLEDVKSGLANYLHLRIKPKQHALIRLFVNGLTGGVALIAGPLIAFITVAIAKPIFGLPMLKEQIETVQSLQANGINSPWLMMILILIMLFICGFIFATMSLGLSTLIHNVYLSLLAPFVVLIFSGTVLFSINPDLHLIGLYDISYTSGSLQQVTLGGTVLAISILLYFIGGYMFNEKYR
ncbi:hypothetical protein [Amphibacillus cookii]|uniref:hypothetical protein n=1 Tax=Amphibacillus cookii TaxID=767787 RepID=UPI00195CEA1D|nr:hypothetical protein [Amphibacillus cookii]MBM7541204.1 hypothetical protein [Amphibacillus cookii]